MTTKKSQYSLPSLDEKLHLLRTPEPPRMSSSRKRGRGQALCAGEDPVKNSPCSLYAAHLRGLSLMALLLIGRGYFLKLNLG